MTSIFFFSYELGREKNVLIDLKKGFETVRRFVSGREYF